MQSNCIGNRNLYAAISNEQVLAHKYGLAIDQFTVVNDFF